MASETTKNSEYDQTIKLSLANTVMDTFMVRLFKSEGKNKV